MHLIIFELLLSLILTQLLNEIFPVRKKCSEEIIFEAL